MTPCQADSALGDLLGELAQSGYQFVTPTPETHRRVIARRDRANDLRGIFGWSLPFDRERLPPRIFNLLESAGALRSEAGSYRSAVRVSSIGGAMFLHSAYPTRAADAVFFGPDSYRFVRFVLDELSREGPVKSLIDIGAGSGVGGIMAGRMAPGASIVLTDINPLALRFARINARHNRVEVKIVEGSGVEQVEEPIHLAISNPPFIKDSAGRAYRDGGEMHGAALSLEWALTTAAKLAPGGRMVLYTASAIVDGRDALLEALTGQLSGLGCTLRYQELDPDIFGEELDRQGYDTVERIAAVGAVISRT